MKNFRTGDWVKRTGPSCPGVSRGRTYRVYSCQDGVVKLSGVTVGGKHNTYMADHFKLTIPAG